MAEVTTEAARLLDDDPAEGTRHNCRAVGLVDVPNQAGVPLAWVSIPVATAGCGSAPSTAGRHWRRATTRPTRAAAHRHPPRQRSWPGAAVDPATPSGAEPAGEDDVRAWLSLLTAAVELLLRRAERQLESETHAPEVPGQSSTA
jgi:hypothetical protein